MYLVWDCLSESQACDHTERVFFLESQEESDGLRNDGTGSRLSWVAQDQTTKVWLQMQRLDIDSVSEERGNGKGSERW